MEEKIVGSSNIDFRDYYFIIEFPTCNSFRQVLEFLNQSHKTIPLIFSKSKLSIRKPNDRQTIIFDGVIEGYNLITYYVDPEELEKRRTSKDIDPEFYIHVPILPLLVNLKRVQKKQRIRIAQKKGKESYITIMSEESGDMKSDIRIDPSREAPLTLVLETPIPTEYPNITMQLSGFHYSATGCGRISDRISKLRAYPHGLEILSSSAQGDSVIKKGDCTGPLICEVVLNGDVMKSISKLASLCDEGIVRIYSNESSHIRLEIPISVIGTVHLYLMNDD